MHKIKLFKPFCVLLILTILACNKKAERLSIAITYPVPNSTMLEDSGMTVELNMIDLDQKIKKIEFYFDDLLLGSDVISPYEYVDRQLIIKSGKHKIEAKAYDQNNQFLLNDKIEINVHEVRTKYTGNFNFSIHVSSYGGVYPAVDTMMYYQGKVRNFVSSDYSQYFFGNSLAGYTGRFLTISFLDKTNIISSVDAEGVIDEELSQPHSLQQGRFTSPNSLSFKLAKGGLGGGYDYKVTGQRY